MTLLTIVVLLVLRPSNRILLFSGTLLFGTCLYFKVMLMSSTVIGMNGVAVAAVSGAGGG